MREKYKLEKKEEKLSSVIREKIMKDNNKE